MLNWGPFEGRGTEAQIADLSSGDGKEQPGPRFIRAGCYFEIVRGGSLVRLAPRELRAGSFAQACVRTAEKPAAQALGFT